MGINGLKVIFEENMIELMKDFNVLIEKVYLILRRINKNKFTFYFFEED